MCPIENLNVLILRTPTILAFSIHAQNFLEDVLTDWHIVRCIGEATLAELLAYFREVLPLATKNAILFAMVVLS